MPYATAQDIVDLYGADFLLLIARRGDENDLSGPLTSAAIDDALAQASSQADSYIGARYPVPVRPVPMVLQRAVIDMACHQLAATADVMTEQIRQRYEDALAWLKDVAAGRAALGTDEAGAAAGDAAAGGNPDEALIASRPPVDWRRWP